MKTRIRRISRKSLSVILVLVMVVTTMMVGTISASAGTNWEGKIYFRVPDTWDLSTYPCIQVWAVQSTSASSGTEYAFLLGNMSVVGSTDYSKLYFCNVNADHSNWHKEYIAFTANTSNWDTGNFFISTCDNYTKPLNYAADNNSNYYIYIPNDATECTITSKNNTMKGFYSSTEATAMKYNTGTHKAYAYTDSSSSSTGGSTTINAYYLNGTTLTNTTDTQTPTAQYENMMQGCKVTATATANTGYDFGGWYSDSSLTTQLSTDTTYTYYSYEAKSIYAKFTSKTYTITYNAGANGSGTVASTTKTHGTAATLSSSTFTRANYTQTGWSTTDGGSKDYNLGGSYTNDANITLYPYWTINSYNVTFTQPSNGEIKVNDSTTSPQDVSYGANYTVKVTPASGYKIKTLTIGGASETSAVGYTTAYEVTKTMGSAAVQIVAEMELNNKFNATVTTSGLHGSSTSTLAPASISDEEIGHDINISASIPTGYDFTGWTIANTSLATFANASSNATTLHIIGVGLPTTITASFSEKMSGLTVATASSTMGTVSSTANSIGIDTSATITALPKQGYRFVSWTVPSGVTISGQTATATVTANTYNSSGYTVTANFEEIMHTVTVSAGTGGTVSPTSVSAGKYTESASITATPNTGYAFSSWSVPSGVTISTGSASSATIKVKATADSETVTASFSELDYPVTIVNNGVTSQVNAHVSTGTTVNSLEKTGYSFEKWTVTGGSIKVNGTTYNAGSTITTANITFTTTSTGVTLTNSYKENKYDITVSAETLSSKALGTVSPAGTLSTGIDTTHSLTATAKRGYKFKEWTKTGGAALSSTSTNPATLSATATGTVTAKFEQTHLYFDITNGGGGGRYAVYFFDNTSGTSFTSQWVDMTVVDGTDNKIYQVAIPSGFSLSNGGLIIGRMKTSTTTNDFGNSLWNKSGDLSINGKKNKFSCSGYGGTDNKILQGSWDANPYFPPVTHDVTFTVTAGGTVTYNETTYAAGSTTSNVKVTEEDKTITATPANGYEFVRWEPSTDVHPTSTTAASTNISATAAGTLKAVFQKINYTITGQNNPAAGGSIKITSDQAGNNEITTAQIGDTFYVTATPTNAYYTFTGFSITSGGTGTTNTNTTGYIGTYTMGYENVTIRANYAATTPVWGTNTDSVEVGLGNSLTYTPVASYWTSITYKLYDNSSNTQVWTTTNSDSSVTIPADNLTHVGVYTLKMTATNAQSGLTSTANYSDVTVTVKYHTESFTYYVDMHSSSGAAPKINFTDSSGTILTKEDSSVYTFALQHRSNGIYSNSIQTPVSSDQTTLYVSVTANDVTTAPIALDVSKLEASEQIWFEATNDTSTELTTHYTSLSAPTNVVGGVEMKRYYLRKPVSWVNQSDGRGKWEQIGMYYWEGTNNSSSWSGTSNMTWLGNDRTYHYYCMDIPSDAKKIIFQGKNNQGTVQVQTINLDGTSGNFWELLNQKVGDKYKADVVKNSDNEAIAAVTPYITRYMDTVAMNKTLNVGETAPCVLPDKGYVGAEASFTSSDPAVATVSSTGVITPVAKGTATITIKVKGTVGANITMENTSSSIKDYVTKSVTVTVHDPDAFAGCIPMSYTSQTTTVKIPAIGAKQPGYIDGFVTRLSGVANGNVYENAGYVTSTEDEVTISGSSVNKVVEYSVKYAASNNDFTGYADITLEADVTTKSIKQSSDTDRYGFDRWERSPTDSNITDALTNSAKLTTQVTSSVETTNVTVPMDGAVYSAIFESYSYTDVTFTFQYYEYKPRVNDGKQVFFYEPEYAAESGFSLSPSQAYLASHTQKSYVLSDIEIRASSDAEVLSASSANSAIKAAAESCMRNIKNNYYTYSLVGDSSVLSKSNTAPHAMAVTVLLTGTPRKYNVYLNDVPFTDDQTERTRSPYYQGEIELTSADAGVAANTNLKWKSDTGEELAIDTGYKFRVTEDTYIKTEAASSTASKDNSSVAKYTGHEITYEKPKERENDTSAENVEKLKQNFYVADFFLPEKVLDPDSDPTGNNDLLPYDDVKFVGGGEFYYTTSSAGKPLSQSIINNGYVDDNGDVVASEIQTAIKDWINDIYYDVHDDDPYFDDEDEANSVMFGTAIPDRVYNAMGFNYYPYEEYSRNSSGALVYDSEKEVYVKTENKDLFRYSNALGAYQYVYGVKDVNNLENEGKKIALYAYYIYSYTDYDDDDNPYTAYSVVVSNKAGADRYVNPTVS